MCAGAIQKGPVIAGLSINFEIVFTTQRDWWEQIAIRFSSRRARDAQREFSKERASS
jgi:hypothetical protein